MPQEHSGYWRIHSVFGFTWPKKTDYEVFFNKLYNGICWLRFFLIMKRNKLNTHQHNPEFRIRIRDFFRHRIGIRNLPIKKMTQNLGYSSKKWLNYAVVNNIFLSWVIKGIFLLPLFPFTSKCCANLPYSSTL